MGAAVGESVGVGVGASVGTDVGAPVGTDVGVGVGVCVSHVPSPRQILLSQSLPTRQLWPDPQGTQPLPTEVPPQSTSVSRPL